MTRADGSSFAPTRINLAVQPGVDTALPRCISSQAVFATKAVDDAKGKRLK